MALLPGGISTEEGHGAPRAKGCIRSWKPWTWRTKQGHITGAGDIGPPLPAFGTPELQYIVDWIINAGNIASAAAFGAANLTEPGTYDWLLIDNADRIIDWSGAGVWYNAANPAQHWAGTKGVPTFPVGVTLTAGDVDITGVVDATATINAALAACPAYHAVLLPYTGPTGSIRINGAIAFGWTNPGVPNGVVLRGDGPGRTRLIKYGTWNCVYMAGGIGPMGSGAVPWVNITAGATKGSTSITVSDATNINIGDVIRVDQLNDDTDTGTHNGAYWAAHVADYLVSSLQPDGTRCTWVGRGWPDMTGTRGSGEMAFVTNKVGNTLTLHRGLRWTYNPTYVPQAGSVIRTPRYLCGVEEVSMISDPSTNTSGDAVNLDYTAYCFFRNIETDNFPDRHIRFANTNIGGEIRRSYAHRAHGNYDGSRGYMYSGMVQSDSILVEDNIVDDAHCPIQFAGGNSGNVVGYNYTRHTHHYSDTWFIQHLGTHACHAWFGLWEGNISGLIQFDCYHGSGSHQLVLRNWLLGRNDGNPNSIQNYHAAMAEAGNKYDSFVGNVLGESGYAGQLEDNPFDGASDNLPGTLWKIGYDGYPYSTGSPTDSVAYSSCLRQGNYDYATLAEDGTPGRAVPDSLYLSSKPSWFGSLAWPCAGPGVSGHHQNNPAKQRWDNYVISGTLADLFADMS